MHKCEYTNFLRKTPRQCRRTARVMVKYRWKQETNTRVVRRCWHHYLEMEQSARASTTENAHFSIIDAVLYGPNEQRELAHVTQ